MKKAIIIVLILLVVGIMISAWAVDRYNSFVALDEEVKNKWAQVENQYQRRVDLIGNLVETAQGSADFQQVTLTRVTEARSAWASAKVNQNISEQIVAAGQLESALSRLLVTVEAYPELDTGAFRDLMNQLEGTENRIAIARQDYNDAVKEYNVAVRRFPANFIARIMDFKPIPSFEAIEGADVAPEVEFDFDNR